MKRIALVLAALVGAAAFAPVFASDDPTSPFYILPTSSQGTTLHDVRAGEPAERK